MNILLRGLDVPPQSGPVWQSPLRVSSSTPPVASACTSCRSMPVNVVGLPISLSSQPSLPRWTRASVPSQASHEPPDGVAAIAIGSGSGATPAPEPVTAGPALTPVTRAAGDAPTGAAQGPAGHRAGGA